MLVLGIESSCDETAAAIVEDGQRVLSNVVHSQTDLHERFRGVVPEVASRSHTNKIIPVLEAAFERSGKQVANLDAIAVTNRPGMIGCLLVGMSAAKALSLAYALPLYGVDHVQAHIHAAFMTAPDLPTPCIALIASGGHTALYRVDAPGQTTRLGATIDDAAGEALDKAAAMLGLPYPGGPAIERASTDGDPTALRLPRPRTTGEMDFSFSGMKTALLYHLRGPGLTRPMPQLGEEDVRNLAASFQRAVVDCLLQRLAKAVEKTGARSICIGGGVARNKLLRQEIEQREPFRGLGLIFPAMDLCSDNGAMIAGVGTLMHTNDPEADLRAGLALSAAATSRRAAGSR